MKKLGKKILVGLMFPLLGSCSTLDPNTFQCFKCVLKDQFKQNELFEKPEDSTSYFLNFNNVKQLSAASVDVLSYYNPNYLGDPNFKFDLTSNYTEKGSFNISFENKYFSYVESYEVSREVKGAETTRTISQFAEREVKYIFEKKEDSSVFNCFSKCTYRTKGGVWDVVNNQPQYSNENFEKIVAEYKCVVVPPEILSNAQSNSELFKYVDLMTPNTFDLTNYIEKSELISFTDYPYLNVINSFSEKVTDSNFNEIEVNYNSTEFNNALDFKHVEYLTEPNKILRATFNSLKNPTDEDYGTEISNEFSYSNGLLINESKYGRTFYLETTEKKSSTMTKNDFVCSINENFDLKQVNTADYTDLDSPASPDPAE